MPISRKKSCARCRQSKLRCSLGTPSCSQCTRRRFKCVYDGRDSERVAPYTFPASSTSTASISASQAGNDIFEHDEIIPGAAIGLDATTADDDALLSFSGGGLPFDWLLMGRPAETGLESPKSFNIDTVEIPSIASSNVLRSLYTHQNVTIPDTKAQHFPCGSTMCAKPSQGNAGGALNSAENASLISFNTGYDHKTLRRRIFLKDCVLTSVVLGQLTSYPKMMVEGDLLPPFIQPPCHYDEEQASDCRMFGRHKCLPEILAICASLVEMFYTRTQANGHFVWRTIYTERARLQEKFATFDHHEQLAAVQSVTVFMLLQSDDLSSVETNDVGALLSTAMEFIVIMSHNYKQQPDTSRPRPARHEWAFYEALRRVSSVFCIVDLLLEGMHAPPGHTCEEGAAFAQNFLPCTRDLWEARSTSRWIIDYDRNLLRRETNEDLRGHHLLGSKLSSEHSGVHSSCMGSPDNKYPNADVLRWCEGLDMLGTLIWMVVPLYRYRIAETRHHLAG